MSEWKKVKLEDCIEIKHGYAFKGEHIINKDNGKVLVTPGNFKIGGGFQESKCKFYNGEIPSDYILHPMDLIVTMTDLSKNIDTLGYSAYVPQDKNRIYLHNQRIGLVIIKNNICTKSFLYWLLRTHDYQRSIAGSSTGSTVHHTSPKKIYEYQFSCPNKDTQIKIADILNKYELLISNYQRQIKLLEEAAQRLYKEWFVDLHFPGYENTKIVDGVPEGWRRLFVDEIYSIKYGKNLSTKLIAKKGLFPVYGANGVIGYYHKENCEEKVVLITSRGNGSGDVFRTYHDRCFVTNNSFIVTANKDYSYCKLPFNYFFLKKANFRLVRTGAAQPQLTNQAIHTIQVLLPTEEQIKSFCKLTSSSFSRIDNFKAQLRLLIEARDRLLPKLMSGEIEV